MENALSTIVANSNDQSMCKQAVSSLNVQVNDRDDIVFNANEEDKKVSGTAAKLGREVKTSLKVDSQMARFCINFTVPIGQKAYHTYAPLVDVNECVLHDTRCTILVHCTAKG